VIGVLSFVQIAHVLKGDTRAGHLTGEEMDELHDSPNQDCPTDTDLLRFVFQGKWRLRVLQEIVKGPVRLSQLRHAVPECTKKVLIDPLHGLEELGWIARQEYPTKLRRVEYSLTPRCEPDVRRAIAIASSEAAASPPENTF
jgi:DNA-binding HxlR family transcriptional regulator